MNIVLAIDSLRPGGKERQLTQLLRGLKQREDLALELVITRREIGYPEVLELGIPIHIIERGHKWDVSIFKRFYSIAREFKADVIHTWDPITTMIALPACKWLRIRLVNESIRHALPIRRFGKLWWLAKLLFPLSDILVANSMAGLKTYGVIPSPRAVCIYNGYDPGRANTGESAESVRRRLGIDTSLVVGMVANFVDAKDYRTFLNAAVAIVRDRDDVSFVCVGDGPMLAQLKGSVPADIENRIFFAGRQQPVEAVIDVFDIGVLTCNTHGHAEGLSNAIMECMGQKKPVIATDSGGNKEIVVHEKTGFLIPPFDADDLEETLRRLLDNDGLRSSMGKAGSLRIQEVFSMENLVNGHIEVYKRVTA